MSAGRVDTGSCTGDREELGALLSKALAQLEAASVAAQEREAAVATLEARVRRPRGQV